MEAAKIINRIYDILKKNHRGKISTNTIVEILNYSEEIFNNNQRYIDIFKELITTSQPWGVYLRLAQKYNVKPQRITEIEKQISKNIYLLEAKRFFEQKITNDEKLDAYIGKLGLNNKIMELLEELHCYKIRDIFDIDEIYFKEICKEKNIDCNEIFERIKILKINPPRKIINKIKLIEELNMPPQTYKFLKKNNINTNQDIVLKIEELICKAPDGKYKIKEQIKRLYDEIIEEFGLLDKENEYVSELKKIRSEQQAKNYKSNERREMLQKRIADYLNYMEQSKTKDATIQNQIQFLLESINKNSENISKREEQINQISDEILKVMIPPSKTRK